MEKVFVCSPYRGDVKRNVALTEAICRKVIAEEKAVPFAPHLYFTRFFDEDRPEERALGIAMGLELMRCCDEVWVYEGEGVSEGMCQEVRHAHALGLPIRRFMELD